MAGPQETRFRTALTGADEARVSSGASDWEGCARLLNDVAAALRKAAPVGETLGGHTGRSLGDKFERAAKNVDDKNRDLRRGHLALWGAHTVMAGARVALEELEQEHNAPEPGVPPKPAPKDADPAEMKQASESLDAFNASARAYAADQAARERISQKWADRMDAVFRDSTDTMKAIHGIEESEGSDGSGPGGGGGPAPLVVPPWRRGAGGDPGPDQHLPEHDHDKGYDGDDPGDDDSGDDDGSHHQQLPGPEQDQDPPDGGDGGGGDHPAIPDFFGSDGGGDHGAGGGLDGLGGGTAGGLAAGGLVGGLGGRALAGGLRGMITPGAVSPTGVRPIGSTSRSAVSGALGRSSVAPGTPVTRGGPGAAGAGRGPLAGAGRTTATGAGRGTGAGRSGGRGTAGTGQAGGRAGRGAGRTGAGGMATGRSRGGKDEEGKQVRRDLFDEGDDWLDDEGAAPDVLD